MKLIKLSRFLELTIIAVSIFIISTVLIYFIIPKILDVHNIIKQPEIFKGNNIGIVGIVERVLTKKDKDSTFMILECGGNSCMAIPVAYEGQIPAIGSNIIAYGKIKVYKGRGRFVRTFQAYKINSKNNDLEGIMFYSIRKEIQKWIIEKGLIKEFREWLYSICKDCPKFKKWIIATPLFP